MHARVPYRAPQRLSGCEQSGRRSELKIMAEARHGEFSIFSQEVLSICSVHLDVFPYESFYTFLRQAVHESKSTV